MSQNDDELLVLPDSNENAADFEPPIPGERDRNGRFVKQEAKEQQEPKQQDSPPQDAVKQDRQPGTVPQGALEAERQKRKRLEREFSELKGAFEASRQPAPSQKVEAPEFWSDPNAATDYRVRNVVDPIKDQFAAYKVQMSHRLNVQQHGEPAVNEAIQAFGELRQSNPGEFQRLDALGSSSFDPVGELVKWHKQQQTLQEVGSDPEAWRNSERERIRAELMTEMQGGPSNSQIQQQPAVKKPMPSSFASMPSGAPRKDRGDDGPIPVSQMLRRR